MCITSSRKEPIISEAFQGFYCPGLLLVTACEIRGLFLDLYKQIQDFVFQMKLKCFPFFSKIMPKILILYRRISVYTW